MVMAMVLLLLLVLVIGVFALPPSPGNYRSDEWPKESRSFIDPVKLTVKDTHVISRLDSASSHLVALKQQSPSSVDDHDYPRRALTKRSTEGRQTSPYAFYWLGAKLWYVPLFFSIYFLLYIIALILKAISRHKIALPHAAAAAAAPVAARSLQAETPPLDLLTARVNDAIASAALRYLKTQMLAQN